MVASSRATQRRAAPSIHALILPFRPTSCVESCVDQPRGDRSSSVVAARKGEGQGGVRNVDESTFRDGYVQLPLHLSLLSL